MHTSVTKEMKIKTTMRYHSLPSRMATSKKTDHAQCWWGSGATGTLLRCRWKCKMVQPLWETLWQFKKLTIHLPYDPAIPHLGNYPRKESTCPYKDCPEMFPAPNWKQPKYSSTGEWINNCSLSIHMSRLSKLHT